MTLTKLSRRDFLRLTGVASGSLFIVANLPSVSDAQEFGTLSPSVWLQISASGQITIWNKIAEMGQGSRSSLAMIIADELDANWQDVEIKQAPSLEQYGVQWTGGSDAVLAAWEGHRKIGAAARQMLLCAASNRLGVDKSKLQTSLSKVVDPRSGQSLSYASLAKAASALPLPTNPTLKTRDQFKLVGNENIQRKEIADIVTGTAQYGMEKQLPDMRYATIVRAPVLGAKLLKCDAAQALAMHGVEQVVEVKGNDFPAYDHIRDGVAIIATSTWAAFKARDELLIEWSTGIDETLSNVGINQKMELALSEPGTVARSEGDIGKAMANADVILEAEYNLPFLAQAPMEPMNATAWVRDGKIEIWTPTQRQTRLQEAVAGRFGIDKFDVIVHTPLLGGSFGRRLDIDYGLEAAIVAKQVSYPVQLVWKREDDMRHSVYRSASKHQLKACIANNQLTGCEHKASHLSVWLQQEPHMMKDGYDGASAAAQTAWPYAVDSFLASQHLIDVPVQVGWLRGVYGTNHTLVNECWLDEIAMAVQQDPIDYRMQLLSLPQQIENEEGAARSARLRSLVAVAKKKSEWVARKSSGQHLGFACDVFSNMTYVAVVAEAKSTELGMKISQLDCFIDCGVATNPDMIRAQFEGGAIWALSALQNAITIEGGKVSQGNFDEYTVPRMDMISSTINVHIIDSTQPPMGVGEPVVTATMPAILNAISSLTGKRQRRLPISFEE